MLSNLAEYGCTGLVKAAWCVALHQGFAGQVHRKQYTVGWGSFGAASPVHSSPDGPLELLRECLRSYTQDSAACAVELYPRDLQGQYDLLFTG